MTVPTLGSICSTESSRTLHSTPLQLAPGCCVYVRKSAINSGEKPAAVARFTKEAAQASELLWDF